MQKNAQRHKYNADFVVYAMCLNNDLLKNSTKNTPLWF